MRSNSLVSSSCRPNLPQAVLIHLIIHPPRHPSHHRPAPVAPSPHPFPPLDNIPNMQHVNEKGSVSNNINTKKTAIIQKQLATPSVMLLCAG